MRARALPLLLLTLLLPGCAKEHEAPPPSILLVTIDTCRADHLSSYGYPLPTTPNLDRLARDGRRYACAFSAAPSTAPSHASILTGKYPTRHTVGLENGEFTLAAGEVTLAELLHAAGYRTGAIVSNPVLRAKVGFDQGFESYDDRFEGVEATRRLPERYADRAVDLALEWLAAEGGRPWFLWLHLQDPHGPYLPPEDGSCDLPLDSAADATTLPEGIDDRGFESIPRYQLVGGRHAAGDYVHRYAREIRSVDHHLGRLFEHLASDPETTDAWIVVTADHGEALGEEGFWFAHGHSVAPDQVRVPLLVVGPGVARGEVVETPVTNVSLFATLLELAGLAPSAPADAPSLFEASERPFFVDSPTELAVVAGNLYLRRRLDADSRSLAFTAVERRHAIDPSRVVPPAAEVTSGALADQALGGHRLRALEARDELALDRRPVVLTPEEVEALRKLGYGE